MSYSNQKENHGVAVVVGLLVAALTIAILWLVFFGLPLWNKWRAGISGQADLAFATYQRRIAVEEAQAKLDASELLNQAEVARARGLAEATALVVDSFGGPDSYLRYLWIQSLENNKANIIYVPTEGGLPILEAGRAVQP
jgi:hypothetical protein